MPKTITDIKLRPDGLTPAQRKFVDFYCGECAGDVAESYIRAGYGSENPAKRAWDLLQRPHIQAAIAWKVSEDDVSPDFIKKNVARLAHPLNSMSTFMKCDEAGNFESFNFKAAIECGLMGFIKSVTLGDEGGVKKVELHDQIGALTLLARMQGMLSDKLVHTGPDGGPIQVENKMVADIARDSETFDLIDAAAQRMALKPRIDGESAN